MKTIRERAQKGIIGAVRTSISSTKTFCRTRIRSRAVARRAQRVRRLALYSAGAVLVCGTARNEAATSLADNTSASGGFKFSPASTTSHARSFTMGASPYTLDSVHFKARTISSASVRVQILTDSSGPGSVLEDLGTVSISGGSYSTFSISSSSTPTLAANTKYWVALIRVSGGYAPNSDVSGVTGSGATINNEAKMSSNGGSTWGNPSGGSTQGFGLSLSGNPATTTVSSVSRVGSTPSNDGSVQWTVTFADSVTGVDSSNFSLVEGGSVSGSSITGVSGSGSSWTVTADTGTGDGTLGLNFANDTDVSPATSNEPFTGAVYTIDKTAPTVAIGSPSASSVIASSGTDVTYTITYADNADVDSVSLADGNITLNATGTATGTVAVSGSGTATRTVTISSIAGKGTLGISLASGTAADAAGNTAVAEGPSTTFDVVTPEIDVHDGPTTTDTSIANNGSSSSIGTTVYGIPITKTFNIENAGNSPLNVSLTTMPANFSLDGAFPGTIANGASATFTVKLDADSVGSHSGNIVIDTDDVDEDPFTFQVSGTVNKATPTVTITSDNPDWNNVNDAVTVNFTVVPPGTGTPTGNVVVADDSGQNVTVDVSTGTASIDCMAVGNRTITATYQGDSNFNSASDTEAHEVRGPSIIVLGNGAGISDGSTSTSSANDTHYGDSGEYPYVVTKTYTIRNDGTDTLNLTLPVTISGDGAGSYTVTTQPADIDLEPGESTTFDVEFAPEIAGDRNATVTINNDDKTRAVFDFAIGGRIIPSAIDLTYNPGVGPNQKVIDVAVQPDGKAVIGGAFITYSGTSRRYVARINVDGSLDTTFDPGTGASHHVNTVDIHTGGKILVGGRFSAFNGTSVGRVARLNADGSLDTTFQTTSGGADGEVYAVAVQPDQKILIGGVFTSVNGVGRVRVARLNADGSLDTTFNAGTGPDLRVRFIELQADGKILVGGNFRKWNGVNHSRIVRLNHDGSLDGTFSSPFPDNGYVSEIIKDESDGDIYVSGGTRRLVRLNSDGSIQWSVGLHFNSDPNAILLTQEGKIITGGYFTTFSGVPRTRLARLNSDGTLDAVFDPQPGANKRFLRLAVEPNGRIIGVGEFTTYRGETRNFITRMMNDIRIAPYFSLQPETQTVEEGTTFTLATMAEGELPVDYQWYKQDGLGVYQAVTDGGNVSGSTAKDLVFNTITAADAGIYKVVATNPGGSTDSTEVVITVSPNSAPTIDGVSNLVLTEDDPQQTVNLAGISNGAAHETHQTLTITATSSDPTIIPDPTVTYTSGEATGTLTFTPVADAFGSVTITLTLTDDGQTANGGVTTTVTTFDITVSPVNDTPTLALTPTTFTVNEDSGAFSQAGFATFSVGPANESGQALNLLCNNTTPGIFAVQPDINDTTGELTFTPAADAFGTATITVYAQDDGGGADTSPSQTFTIIVNAVNDQPGFTLDVGTINFVEDSGFNQVTIITSTTRGPANEITQKVDRYEIVGNTNPGLLTGVEVSSNGILKANTVAGVTGSTVITIQLVDNGGTANGGVDTSAAQSFTVTVGPPNFPPDFDLAANLYTHLEDSGSHSVANFVTGVGPGDVSEAGQSVTMTISAADPTLFASGPTLTANGGDYDLSYTLAADAAGSTLVTVTGTDDGPGTAAQNKTFTVTITEVNDEPGFVVGTDQTVNEDSGAHSVSGFLSGISAGPASESGQTLTFHVSNDNNALFSTQPAIDSSGDLTFTPNDDVSGSATVSVYLTDNGGTDNAGDDTSETQTFTITVSEVNDEPSFTAGANVSAFRGDGAYDAAWATDLNPGAANESGQTLTFNITANDNPGLFASGPVIDGTTGNLSFTPSVTANGTANITVELQDDGGTDNGGDDTSASVTFAITIAGTRVFVDGNPGLSGDTITVPIDLDGTGVENSVSFTLDYDASQLSFDSGALGSGATGASIVLNSDTSGKVGVLVILPAGTTFAAGNNNIANLTFSLANTATVGTSALAFSSTPVLQQLTEVDADIITGITYVGATVTLSEGTNEGDVAPRPLGNGTLSVADATQIGRFAAGLDTANNGTEFQRADTAPKTSSGDGVISIADWVQSLRYIAGTDVSQTVGGPDRPSLAPAAFGLRAATLSGRRVELESDGLKAGRGATLRLVLDAAGDEAGLSCSLQFDPGALAFGAARVGAGANGAFLIVNSQQAQNGVLGIVLALSPGTTVNAGRQVMVELDFTVAATATTANIAINSSPVAEEVTDSFARRLPAMFVGQSFPVELPAGFAAVGVEMVDGLPQFTFGSEDGSPVAVDQLNDLEVYVTGDIAAANWTKLENALQLNAGKVRIVDPGAGSGMRFYQVRRVAATSGGGSASQ